MDCLINKDVYYVGKENASYFPPLGTHGKVVAEHEHNAISVLWDCFTTVWFASRSQISERPLVVAVAERRIFGKFFVYNGHIEYLKDYVDGKSTKDFKCIKMLDDRHVQVLIPSIPQYAERKYQLWKSYHSKISLIC